MVMEAKGNTLTLTAEIVAAHVSNNLRKRLRTSVAVPVFGAVHRSRHSGCASAAATRAELTPKPVRSCCMDGEGELYDEATKVSAVDGEVILDGPDGIDVRMTPEAALETSDKLLEASAKAAGQRRFKGLKGKPPR